MKEFWNKVRSTVYLYFIPKCLVLLCLSSLLFACVVEEGIAELNYTPVVVSTANVSLITANSAVCGGTVTDTKDRNITARGVCWSTSSNPTIDLSTKTSDGTGTGTFTSFITALTAGTTYYIRTYATTSFGTVYGNEVNFFVIVYGEVTNPSTGRTWLDRNLGAIQVATSSTDELAFGDLYQWGRGTDGHEKRTSATTSSLSSTDTPGHGNFIISVSSPYDWRSTHNNNLWQGVNGVNNPCPAGFRIPTFAEWEAERASWSSNNSSGAFASPLKLPAAGSRSYSNGMLGSVGSIGYYWSAIVFGNSANSMNFVSNMAVSGGFDRAYGFSVRCIKD